MAVLDLYIVTFNCGRAPIDPDIFASHLFSGLLAPTHLPDIVVLDLQEIAPIASSFLTSALVAPYLDGFSTGVRRAAARYPDDVSAKGGYVEIIRRNLGMTAIMMFAREGSEASIRWIEEAGVGTGWWGVGNKGAVGLRMGYSTRGVDYQRVRGDPDEVQFTFVAAHLAPHEIAVERRNQDWANIVKGLVFTPVEGRLGRRVPESSSSRWSSGSAEDEPLLLRQIDGHQGIYTPRSYVFFGGDLNYRTKSTGPSDEDHLTFPQPTTDTDDQRHFSNLLSGDQLTREKDAGRTLHGFLESPVTFPPTYKYKMSESVPENSGTLTTQRQWDWAPHRWPSWCDRILYLPVPPWVHGGKSSSIQVHDYTSLPNMPTSDHRPVVLSLSVALKPIPAPPEASKDGPTDLDDMRLSPPFAIDAEWKINRFWARQREISIGLAFFLGLTWEGNAVLGALFLGGFSSLWLLGAFASS
jgi:hypothetical protein